MKPMKGYLRGMGRRGKGQSLSVPSEDGHAGPAPAPQVAGDPPQPPADEAGQWPEWAQIVIDRPIFEFEPNAPTAATEYRPDTVLDGWSTKSFTVRLASVRGYSHRYNGAPRQDDVAAAADPRTGIVVFAVADGVSSASCSHIGASIACAALVELQRRMLDSEGTIDLPRAVQTAASRINRRASYLLKQDNPEQAAVEKLLATTLTAGYMEPGPEGALVTLVQIGDSGAWALQDGRYYSLLDPKNDPDAPTISSAVSPLPRLPAQIVPVQYRVGPEDVLLVGTDGFGDPLGDGDGQVGQLFAEHLVTPPPARGLAHMLDFSRDTFDDDRTLLAIWQQPR